MAERSEAQEFMQNTVDVYWMGQSKTKEGKVIGQQLTAHKDQITKMGFTPADTECEEYIAVCGHSAQSWFSPHMGIPQTFFGTTDSAKKAGAVLCNKCFLDKTS